MKKYYQYHLNRLERIRNFLKCSSIENRVKNDLIGAWFVFCYHMRDVLLASGCEKIKVDEFIDNSDCLSVCRVIANTEKHVNLTNKHKAYLLKFPDLFYTPIFRQSYSYADKKMNTFIVANSQHIEPVALMDKCLNEWKIFIKC